MAATDCAPTTPSKGQADQVAFLIACIKHSTNGKPDFHAVAADCSMVSHGAAAKRYERICKANGISRTPSKPAARPPAADDDEEVGQDIPSSPTPKKAAVRKPRGKKAAVKKESSASGDENAEAEPDANIKKERKAPAGKGRGGGRKKRKIEEVHEEDEEEDEGVKMESE